MGSNYWQRAYAVGRSVYRDTQLSNVDEQAGPAYFDALSLSRWLFWRRLKWAVGQIQRVQGTVALEFGCGFGILLPTLQQRFQQTIAVDLVPELARQFCQRWDQENTAQLNATPQPPVTAQPQKVSQPLGSLQIVSSLAEARLENGTVDLIVALDVLEHCRSLPEVIAPLAQLLKPNGNLIVSGPTESWFYQLGRRIVGFTGDYHHQTIYDVHAALSTEFTLQSVKRLPFVPPLFLLSVWRK